MSKERKCGKRSGAGGGGGGGGVEKKTFSWKEVHGDFLEKTKVGEKEWGRWEGRGKQKFVYTRKAVPCIRVDRAEQEV